MEVETKLEPKVDGPPPAPAGFREPTPDERNLGFGLLNYRCAIFWDGEGQWFQGTIVNYNEESRMHVVFYDGSDAGVFYDEELHSCPWLISLAPVVFEPGDGSIVSNQYLWISKVIRSSFSRN